eukprot:Opistho-1_new@89256
MTSSSFGSALSWASLGDLLQLGAVDDLRHRHARLLHRQPHHRDQVGNDQDDVLCHLRPGDGAHAAEERAHQDTAEADEHADLERQPAQARRDQSHAVDLRHHVGERAQDGGKNADESGQIAAIAFTQKIWNGELAELAQIGCEEQRHQAVAAGPAHDEGETTVAGEVQRTGHADEGRGRHPVGAGGHAVVDGWHATAGHVVFGRIGGAAHDADAGIQGHGGQQEDEADVAARQPHLLEHRQHDHEGNEAAGVPGVDLVQLRLESRIGGATTARSRRIRCDSSHVSPPRRRRVLDRGDSSSWRSTR